MVYLVGEVGDFWYVVCVICLVGCKMCLLLLDVVSFLFWDRGLVGVVIVDIVVVVNVFLSQIIYYF